MKRYEIEDRRKAKPGTYGAGYFVVWSVRSSPFPCYVYAGQYGTKREAMQAIFEMRMKQQPREERNP